MSLFEVHSSVIANVQLHNDGVLNVDLLGDLLTYFVYLILSFKAFPRFHPWQPFFETPSDAMDNPHYSRNLACMSAFSISIILPNRLYALMLAELNPLALKKYL